MVNGATYDEIQSAVDPLYLHEKILPVPGTNAVIIGNNGWYDYSLGTAGQYENRCGICSMETRLLD